MSRQLQRKGFSFWEFLIIVAIVAVLVAIAFPRLFKSDLHVVTQPAASAAPGSSSPVSVRLMVGGKLADTKERITFAVSEGGGRVEPAVVETDSNGKATTTWILGTTPGTRNALTATSAEGATTRVEVVTGGVVNAPASSP
jgi:Tfp pilus assembly major pilin PilA